MSRRAAAGAVTTGAVLAALVMPLAGCGPLDRQPVTVPTVTTPAVSGAALSPTEFTARAEAACTRLYSRLGRLGTPPTDNISDARRYYPAVADAWHRLLDEAGALSPPADLRQTWTEVVEAYRATAQNSDENVLLARTDREAIEIVNSDASARMQEAQVFMASRAADIGLRACAGAGSATTPQGG
ncbi:MAG: hypothetical protein ACKOGE_05545 [Actinomycetota bacterium]